MQMKLSLTINLFDQLQSSHMDPLLEVLSEPRTLLSTFLLRLITQCLFVHRILISISIACLALLACNGEQEEAETGEEENEAEEIRKDKPKPRSWTQSRSQNHH